MTLVHHLLLHLRMLLTIRIYVVLPVVSRRTSDPSPLRGQDASVRWGYRLRATGSAARPGAYLLPRRLPWLAWRASPAAFSPPQLAPRYTWTQFPVWCHVCVVWRFATGFRPSTWNGTQPSDARLGARSASCIVDQGGGCHLVAALSGCALSLLNWLLVIPKHNSLCGGTCVWCDGLLWAVGQGRGLNATFELVLR